MKLIDILVQALPAIGGWPENVTHIGQDYDRELMFYGRGNPRSGIILDQLAADHRKYCENGTKITREQYEAALAAKNEGWIEWGGGLIPISTNMLVDVKFNNGDVRLGKIAGEYSWEHVWEDPNIIAYRLHKPTKSEQVRSAAWNAYAGITKADDESSLNECISHDAAPVWSGEGLPPVGCFCEVEDRDGMLVYGRGESGEVIAHVENTAVIRMSYGLGCFEAGFLRPLRTEAERKRKEAIEEMIKIATIHTTKSLGLDLALRSCYDAIAAGKIPGLKLED